MMLRDFPYQSDESGVSIVAAVAEIRGSMSSATIKTKAARLVTRLLRLLRRTTDSSQHVLRTTALWALTLLVAVDGCKEQMLALGAAGQLLGMLEPNGRTVGAEREYAEKLGKLISGSAYLVSGSVIEDPFLPYALSDGNAKTLRELFPEQSAQATDPPTAGRRVNLAPLASVRTPNIYLMKQRHSNPPSFSSSHRLGKSSPSRRPPLSLTFPPLPATTSDPSSPHQQQHVADPLFQRVSQSSLHTYPPVPIERVDMLDGIQRTRIPADSLICSAFMKRLFSAPSLSSAQSLVSSTARLLSILDKPDSGYVSWSDFSDVLLSVAPAHMVRTDIVLFLNTQAESPSSLIDYREFLISGKLLILDEFCLRRELMSTSGWLERQKNQSRVGSGGQLLSWSSHVAWFTKRRASAVVALMRRANGAISQSSRVDAASAYLNRCAAVAVAFAFLLDCSAGASRQESARSDAKKRLILRSLRGRRHQMQREEAAAYLNVMGSLGKESSSRSSRRAVRRQHLAAVRLEAKMLRSGEASINTAYSIYHHQKQAAAVLVSRAGRALNHWMRTLNDVSFLLSTAASVLLVEAGRTRAFAELARAADRAVLVSSSRDMVWGRLVIVGSNAVAVCGRIDSAAHWLSRRALRAGAHVSRSSAAGRWLTHLGQLRLVTKRSGEYLRHRVKAAIVLIYAQEAAIHFLRDFVSRTKKHLGRQQMTQIWLRDQGPRAVLATIRREEHLADLTWFAARALNTFKAQDIAFADLVHLGREARLDKFLDEWSQCDENKERLADETSRVEMKEKRVATARKEWPVEDFDKAYFKSATVWFADLTAQADRSSRNGAPLISRRAFLALFSGCKKSRLFLSAEFDRLVLPGGCADADDIWSWYWDTGDADLFDPSFSFEHIIPSRMKIALILFRRFILLRAGEDEI